MGKIINVRTIIRMSHNNQALIQNILFRVPWLHEWVALLMATLIDLFP